MDHNNGNNRNRINLEMSTIQFLSELYNNSSIPRNIVPFFVQSVQHFVENTLIPCIKNEITEHFNNNCSNGNSSEKDHMIEILDSNTKVLSSLSTEYNILKQLKSSGKFFMPETFLIGDYSKFTSENSRANGQYISVTETLKQVLSIPGFLTETKQFMKSLFNEKEVITNFIQADFWRNRMKTHENKFVLPIFIYFDDFEPGNALGSHAGKHKIGAVYMSIPCIPVRYSSKLDHIYLIELFYSKDRTKFGNTSVFQKLIDEMNNLYHNGINIKNGNIDETIHFEVALVTGDNLGLNSMFGFVESFSARYCCRICRISSNLLKTSCEEDEQLIRSVESYNSDVLMNNPIETGVKNDCVWNKLKSFHVCENIYVDIMHDLAEGVCSYTLTTLINYYINKEVFTLDTLNYRMETFDYGFEKANKPPVINKNHLKCKLKMSASEMLCFTRYFGIMMGDLIDEDNYHWKLYLSLRGIVEIVTSPQILRGHVALLNVLITEYNALYVELFGNLKPKMHFMTHYKRVSLLMGPLVNIWTMRYEGKHREFKKTATSISGSKNLIKSLAIKYQLKMFHILNYKTIHEKIYGPEVHINPKDVSKLLPGNIIVYKWIEINGIRYNPDTIVTVDINTPALPKFGKIILVGQIDDVTYFLVHVLHSCVFNDHLYAYEVEDVESECALSYNDLRDKFPKILVCKSLKQYVCTRHLM